MTQSTGLAEARLLYLGFAFPPGVAALHPNLNPAGHALETQMVAQLRHYFDIRSVGLLPFEPPQFEAADPASGIDHDLVLLERPPELCHRLRSLARLKSQYRLWRASGWRPDLILVYNLSPVYNEFISWLRRQGSPPRLVLLLLDSPNLGQKTSWLKQARRRLKPMFTADSVMISRFDACVGLSRAVEKYFHPRGIPFLWMPGGCTPSRALLNGESTEPFAPQSMLRFGYFGALGPHAGVTQMIEAFLLADPPATLEICGYGKCNESITAVAARNGKIKYHGLLTPADCLRFGRSCNVLINPRPATHGNENNFASKLFEYALSGRAILTSKLSGVEAVLGAEAFYFDPQNFQTSLRDAFANLARLPSSELDCRGVVIQERIVKVFAWENQAARLAAFLKNVCSPAMGTAERTEALAA